MNPFIAYNYPYIKVMGLKHSFWAYVLVDGRSFILIFISLFMFYFSCFAASLYPENENVDFLKCFYFKT